MSHSVGSTKYALQNALYAFPYHYIPFLDASGSTIRYRLLDWGHEYMCYMLHVTDIISTLEPDSVLDVGCGDGRLFHLLRNHTAQRRLGVDPSESAIAIARAFNPQDEFFCGVSSEVSELFDLVTAIEVLEHIPDDDMGSFVSAAVQLIAPGGRLLLSVPTTNTPLNKKHYRHYDLDLLLQHVSPERHGLTVESVQYVFNRDDRLYRWYKRATGNKYWFLNVHAFERWMWNHVWCRMRIATPESGAHLVVMLRNC